MSEIKPASNHWADINAAKIVREKADKEKYVCASGITPSGTVHIGNFREIMSVDLVVRALKDMGKNVRFLYSWDEFDVFRKVPKNMPNQEDLEQYLRWPITMVPDPFGRAENYARGNEKQLEEQLHIVGIDPEYIYQAAEYRGCKYAEGIKIALEKKAEIKSILDSHRTTPLDDDWWPVSIFCNNCNKDTTIVESWDGDFSLTYSCESCGHHETFSMKENGAAKLPWRIDWPMRWKQEQVDFEPAGKDHHSEGGSFDTAREIVSRIFNAEAPVTFQYDFIRIKGRGGKISSSSGEVVSLKDVLEVYEPEVTRYLFAGTRPNTEFAISFDLDVLKIYEDYDKCERIYYGVQQVNEKKAEKEQRIYELSQVSKPSEIMPYQISFRHLTNLLQINSGNIDATIASFEDVKPEQMEKLKVRARCAWNWVTQFSPEEFRFSLQGNNSVLVSMGDDELSVLQDFREFLREKLDEMDEKTIGEGLYQICGKRSVEPKEFFPVFYNVLIGKERGPRLAGFLKTVGEKKILSILDKYK